MLKALYDLINNPTLLGIEAWIGVALTIFLGVLFILKRNRDERGWKIFGKASVLSFVYFMIATNVVALMTMEMNRFGYAMGFLFFAHIIQFIYDTVLLVEILAIGVFKIRE